jgi:elongation factor 1-gamma
LARSLQKLYTPPGNFRAFKILVAAEYNGIGDQIEVVTVDLKKDGKSPAFLAKSPAGKVPVLETPSGAFVVIY